MSVLELKWVAPSTPGFTSNPYLHPKVRFILPQPADIMEIIERDTPRYLFFEEVQRAFPDETYFFTSMTISLQVEKGEKAVEILRWFRNHPGQYKVKSFEDDLTEGYRDYSMKSVFEDDIFTPGGFSVFMYFTGGECTFKETTEIAEVIPAEPAKEAVIRYKKKLICGDVEIPEGAE